MTIEEAYRKRHALVLEPLATALSALITEYVHGEGRIDRVSARAKSIERFLKKASSPLKDGTAKYIDPLNQIQDQVGARVTVFYRSDVERVSDLLLRYLRPTESKDLIPASEWEFGYFGRHIICLFPQELILPTYSGEHIPQFFELQIKTLFQHAWSEANHDLGYKPESGELTHDQIRTLAFTSAQAWGADKAFDELFQDLQQRRE